MYTYSPALTRGGKNILNTYNQDYILKEKIETPHSKISHYVRVDKAGARQHIDAFLQPISEQFADALSLSYIFVSFSLKFFASLAHLFFVISSLLSPS